MSAIGEAVGIAVLAGWFAATVAGQLPGERWQQFRRRANFLGLLPYWGFFTSRLATKDYHLCWRPMPADGPTGDWQEVGPGGRGERPPASALWHPARRPRKALVDLALALVTFQEVLKLEPALIRACPPYLALRDYCARSARAAGVPAFEFAILASHGRDSGRPRSVYFLSARHEP